MRRLAIILTAWMALAVQDAVWADSAPECRRINDIVKDIEAGRSPWLLDARFTLIESKIDQRGSVRRYSMHLPRLDASELMQLEIIDDPYLKSWEASLEARQLRFRPYSVSHWIDVMPHAVALEMGDTDAPCLQAKGESCGGFAINFESKKNGAIQVGFFFAFAENKQHVVDHVTLALREGWCSDPDRFDK